MIQSRNTNLRPEWNDSKQIDKPDSTIMKTWNKKVRMKKYLNQSKLFTNICVDEQKFTDTNALWDRERKRQGTELGKKLGFTTLELNCKIVSLVVEWNECTQLNCFVFLPNPLNLGELQNEKDKDFEGIL